MILPDKVNQTLEVPPSAYIPSTLREQVLNVDDILQICSILCSLLLIFGYIFIRATDKTLDRLSLRLLVYSCFLNIIFGICQILLNNHGFEDAERSCDVVMAFFVFSDMCTTLLLTCIAVNLWIHIVYKAVIVSPRVLEAIYVLGCLVFTAFMAITPFFSPADVYLYNPSLSQCWFATSVPPTPMEIFWQLWLFHVWQLTGVIASLFAFVSVMVVLRREEISIDDNIASAQATVHQWSGTEDKSSPALIEHDQQTTLDIEHNLEISKSNHKKRPSVVSSLSRRTMERGKIGCCYMLKFWLPRRAFSAHRQLRKTAIHASLRNSRNISYVAKTIRQVICYSSGFISTGAKGPLLLLCFMIDPALWSAIKLIRRRRKERNALGIAQPPPAPVITTPAALQKAKAASPLSYDDVDVSFTMKDRSYSDVEMNNDDISIIASNGGTQESTIKLGDEPVTSAEQLVECPGHSSKNL
ncbi:hypothetical protein INT43_006599 [Umbelopsis isabellina]|uniref:G-protein coupled receptors family 2 profile 2 domain-containing protein n=1 Tax=Mortierella isabellina TaxID=91625 RepID=A0A8H7UKX7_MORIS|nr:hypothetical protein INT43_006599 [Umbelopsis isabellina]